MKNLTPDSLYLTEGSALSKGSGQVLLTADQSPMVLRRTPVFFRPSVSLVLKHPHLWQFLHRHWVGHENDVKSLFLAVQTNRVPAVEPPTVPFRDIAPRLAGITR